MASACIHDSKTEHSSFVNGGHECSPETETWTFYDRDSEKSSCFHVTTLCYIWTGGPSRYSSTQEDVRLLSSLGCPPTRHPHTRRGSLRLQGVSILRFVSIQGSTALVTLAALLGLSSRSIGTTTLASRARGCSCAGMPCPALPGPRGWSSRISETPLSSTVVAIERARRPWSRTDRLVELEGRFGARLGGKSTPGLR